MGHTAGQKSLQMLPRPSGRGWGRFAREVLPPHPRDPGTNRQDGGLLENKATGKHHSSSLNAGRVMGRSGTRTCKLLSRVQLKTFNCMSGGEEVQLKCFKCLCLKSEATGAQQALPILTHVHARTQV